MNSRAGRRAKRKALVSSGRLPQLKLTAGMKKTLREFLRREQENLPPPTQEEIRKLHGWAVEAVGYQHMRRLRESWLVEKRLVIGDPRDKRKWADSLTPVGHLHAYTAEIEDTFGPAADEDEKVQDLLRTLRIAAMEYRRARAKQGR